jgi:DNA-binding NarL/FixJ family response regulator
MMSEIMGQELTQFELAARAAPPSSLALFCEEEVLAAGLLSLLPAEIKVSGRYTDLVSLQDGLKASRPDLLLIEVSSSVTLTTISDLRSQTSGTRIILWVDKVSGEFVSHCLTLGVSGILCRNSKAELHLKCLLTVARGEQWVDGRLAATLKDSRQIHLSRRERQITSLLLQGLPNKEIAWQLGLTHGTVKVYMSRLFNKVGVGDRYELALLALRNFTVDTRNASHRPGDVTTGWLPAEIINSPRLAAA